MFSCDGRSEGGGQRVQLSKQAPLGPRPCQRGSALLPLRSAAGEPLKPAAVRLGRGGGAACRPTSAKTLLSCISPRAHGQK